MNEVVLQLNTRALLNYLQKSMGDIDAPTAKIVNRAAQKGVNFARQQAPKADSTLTNSIRANRVTLSHQQIVAGAHYSKYVEDGTKKGGWVPAQTLTDWLNVKNITPADSEMSMEDLVFLVQKKIYNKGTPAQPFMAPTKAELIKILPEITRSIMQAHFDKYKGEL